jgi:hypothetical protein
MKRSLLFLSSLVLIIAFMLPGSAAFAQAQRPLTTPYCYGDGLPGNNPPIQPCDGLPYNNCGQLVQQDAKPIGNIGTLYLDMSVYTGTGACAAWFSYVYIYHAGCYQVIYNNTVETHADSSTGGYNTTVCQGQRAYTTMIGEWQGGGNNGNGCYYANSDVYINGTQGFTSTGTFCF